MPFRISSVVCECLSGEGHSHSYRYIPCRYSERQTALVANLHFARNPVCRCEPRHSNEFLYHWIWLDTGGKSGGKYGKLRPFTLYPSHTLFAYPKNRKETPVRRYLLKQDPVVGLTPYCFYESGHNPPLIHSSLQPFAQTIKKEMRPEGTHLHTNSARGDISAADKVQPDYFMACSTATATATVAPTIGLLPMPRKPIISTCAGTDDEPAN